MNPLLALLLPLTLLAPRQPSVPTADEGMWTFDSVPLARLDEDYGFKPSPEWLEHVRLSSVRVNDGGSASFISPNGLVLTNHHVGFNAIQKLSSEQKDYINDGFYAASLEEELTCTDLELNVLESMEDVTERVHGAVKADADEKVARKQRDAVIAAIEKEQSEATGLRCNVIELYQGGVYVVYRYKKYTEVKLVFAPEQQAAFFGGDPDNFTFPRYALDMCIFRVYDGDQPAKTPHYLKWSRTPIESGDLVFVSGNPGSTGRLNTLAQLEYLRDDLYPRILRNLSRRKAVLADYSSKGAEQERQAKLQLFGVENSIKAVDGYLQSLQDERAFERKGAEEHALRSAIEQDPSLAAEVGPAWDAIASAQATAHKHGKATYYSTIRGSRLYTMARHLVRLSAELEKPNGERLPEYRDSNLESLKLSLFSEAPIYPQFEDVLIAGALAEALEELGPEDPFVRAALGIKQPIEAVSKTLTRETKLTDVEFRKSLLEGGKAAIEACEDPMIQLALRVDPVARERRMLMKESVDSVETLNGKKIALARFQAYGRSVYPDATFTLRLSYGAVRGFETGGYNMPFKTSFHGLYERAAAFDNQPPYDITDRWMERRGDLELDTPYNFVCTADIIGGNSGSPVIDRKGELVGLIFDGNIESLGNRFVFDDTVARSVAVHASGMLEAMRKIYRADALVAEILAAAEGN